MKLTQSEKILLTRWRLKFNQKKFYQGICDQQTGSYLESGTWKGDIARIESITKKIKQTYSCRPKNITIGEMIKLMRLRLGIKLSEAMAMFKLDKVSQIKVEKGKKKDNKQLRTYQKMDGK